MTNPFNCPDSIYDAMMLDVTPLLMAIRRLGPDRVQWAGGNPPKRTGAGVGDSELQWLLDGCKTTENEIRKTVGLPPVPMNQWRFTVPKTTEK